jgi:hypothetical protein
MRNKLDKLHKLESRETKPQVVGFHVGPPVQVSCRFVMVESHHHQLQVTSGIRVSRVGLVVQLHGALVPCSHAPLVTSVNVCVAGQLDEVAHHVALLTVQLSSGCVEQSNLQFGNKRN